MVSLRLRSRTPLILIGLLLLLQVLEPWHVWLHLLLALGGLLAVSYYWARQMRDQVTPRREMSRGWLFVGDRLEEQFQLENRSFLPLLWAEIVDHSTVPGYSANIVQVADGRSTRRWTTRGICLQRGAFTLGPWEVRTGDPFGLFTVRLLVTETSPVMVYPPVVRVPPLPVPVGRASGRSRTLRRGIETTTDASGVRDYQPGDPVHRVHWRSVARQDRWMVKEFDLEPSGDLWIVLDLQESVQAGEGEESTLEYGVILAASLLAHTLSENRAVGLMAFGQSFSFLMPARGPAQLWNGLRTLATLQSGKLPLQDVLGKMQPNVRPGTTLAIITPSTSPAWLGEVARLQARGVTAAAILLEAGSFGGQGMTERDEMNGLRQALARLRIPNLIIRQGHPFVPWLRPKRKRTVYRTLATGRVIAMEVSEEV